METTAPVLRCTSRLLALLGSKPGWVDNPPGADDDWYANVFWLNRRKWLLVTHAGTLFTGIRADIKKADITPIGDRICELMIERCRSDDVSPELLGVTHLGAATIAKTASKSVLAVMSQMQIELGHIVRGHGGYSRLDEEGWNHFLNRALRKRGPTYTTPLDLVEAWRAART